MNSKGDRSQSKTGFLVWAIAWAWLGVAMLPQELLALEPIEVPAKKDDLEEVNLKSQLEERLTQAVQAYLGHQRFIVNVDAEIEKIRTLIKEPIPAPDNPLKLPPKRNIESLLANADDDQQGAIDFDLPGLPVNELPSEDQETEDTRILKLELERLQKENDEVRRSAQLAAEQAGVPVTREKTLGYHNSIKKLVVTLVVDKRISAEQQEFLRNLIFKKAQLDSLRGDSFNLVKTDFKDIQTPGDAEPEAEAASGLLAKLDRWLGDYAEELLALLLGLVLLLLLLFFFSWRRLRRQNQAPMPYHQPPRELNPMPEPGLPPSPEVGPSVAGQLMAPEAGSQTPIKPLADLRQELITFCLGQPQKSRRRLNELLAEPAHQGQIASVYKLLGHSLFMGLFPQVPTDHLKDILSHLENQPPSPEQIHNDLQQLQILLMQNGSDTEDADENRPFAFLEKLSNSQIIYLLKEEEPRIKALVFSQLPAERAAALIKELPKVEQVKIASEIGQFDTFPLSAFKDIANRLAKQSLDVPDFDNLSADGVTLLIRMLDNMQTDDESILLAQLEREDPAMYHRVRQIYFNFSDLKRTPGTVLKDLLREMDRKTLATALFNADEQLVSHVLTSLPDKLRLAVKDELNYQAETPDNGLIEKARGHIVQAMRALIRSGKFSMEQLSAET